MFIREEARIKIYETGKGVAEDFWDNYAIIHDKVLEKWNYRTNTS